MADKQGERKTKNIRNSKWKDEYLVTVYELAREGMTELQMAKVMNVSKPTFINWERDNKLFRMMLKAGRDYRRRVQRPYVGDHLDYIYHQLPEDLKTVWQKLFRAYTKKASFAEVEAIMNGVNKVARQRLFVCALIKSNFNVSGACRLTGISRLTAEYWKKDKEFQNLIHEVHLIQKEWTENCLIDLVDAHDFGAVRMANQYINKEKYGEANRIQLDVSGKVEHEHRHLVSIADMRIEGEDGKMEQLPLNIQKMLLEGMRNARKLVESKEVKEEANVMEAVG